MDQRVDKLPDYAELHCITNFTFLRGASHPEELVERADALGYTAVAITDECSLAGVVRAHVAARARDIKLIVGTELRLEEGTKIVLLATDRSSYGHIAELITYARRRAEKGEYRVGIHDLSRGLGNTLAVWIPDFGQPDEYPALAQLARYFANRLWIGIERFYTPQSRPRLRQLLALSGDYHIPLVATGDVHMHCRTRRPMQDVLTAIRLRCSIAQIPMTLHPNAERHLRSRAELAQIFSSDLLEESVNISNRIDFSLDELRYEYPHELAPPGKSPSAYLRELTQEGMNARWTQGAPDHVRSMVEHELRLIEDLGYEPYFLTVYDIVRFARSRGILCQGRGSAANSTVCYCLGITEVDPSRMAMLFERFVSKERNEPPDIDVDFEHERREEVIQYIYSKYGRDRAALAATVICYRPRSAIRDVGKALGLNVAQIDRLAKSTAWWDGSNVLPERFKEAGLNPTSAQSQRLCLLVGVLIGFPRHLSQHVGGFVISEQPLCQLVPIENAAMVDRTVIQWDKDDLEALGLLKVDVLALGMLSAIRRALAMISVLRGKPFGISDVPAEDPGVYDMISRADTVGVFQIESRAQMAMLPRLRPRTFYDLVIEVAIVRPGPIQGGMVHPYLRRRQGLEAITYPSQDVRSVLERTLGIPIFQEQVMQLAVVAAGFSPGEADQLRRAMAAWKRKGGLGPFEERLISGMRERGYKEDFARQIFQQILGFGDYGFPESHSASFALLVYVSSWIKCYEPAAFTCALLNSQPMGFYAPSQLVQDARRHGVEVRGVDINYSDWDCTLEPLETHQPALRLGFRMIKGLSIDTAEKVIGVRDRPFNSVENVARRTRISQIDMERLADGNAFAALSEHRHAAHWQVGGVERLPALFIDAQFEEVAPQLRAPSEGEDVLVDYATLGLTLGRHPVSLLRRQLGRLRPVATAERVRCTSHGEFIRASGLVIGRQRPSTASGVIFMTLEDETGTINVVIWPWVLERQRREVLGSRLVEVAGIVEREREVVHLIAGQLADRSELLGQLDVHSRDFH
ncbi:MAG: error-prone DNA polymerase [Gammaproteobacteria bacterium]|nr:error-prone DNA polymerase [Gammaproteobacteria bacterium]